MKIYSLKISNKLSTFLLISIPLLLSECDLDHRIQKESLRLSQESDILLKERNYEKAKNVIKDALVIDSNNYIALNNKSFVEYYTEHDTVKALLSLDKALSVKQDYIPALINRTIIIFEQKKYEEAIESCYSFNKLKGYDPQIEFIKGESLNYLGKYKLALVALNKAQASLPNRPGVYKERSRAHRNLGQFEQAIYDGQKAIKLDSCYHQAYNTLALAYDANEQVYKALKTYDLAINYDSTAYTYYCNRGLFKIEKLKQFESGCNDLYNSYYLGSKLAQQHIHRYCTQN